jgi:hypothetical protein
MYSKYYKIRTVIANQLWDEIKNHGDVRKIDGLVAQMLYERYGIDQTVEEYVI